MTLPAVSDSEVEVLIMVGLPPKNNEKGINTGKTSWQPSPNGIQQEGK